LSLSDVVHRLKTMTTKRYVDGVKQNGWPRFNRKLWQRGFYEHIIRNENELTQIREYITNNPQNWTNDRNNPVVPNNIPVGAGPRACPESRACPEPDQNPNPMAQIARNFEGVGG